jgi:hypothetical protein
MHTISATIGFCKSLGGMLRDGFEYIILISSLFFGESELTRSWFQMELPPPIRMGLRVKSWV